MNVKSWALAIVLHGSIFAAFVGFLLWNSGHFRKPVSPADPVAESQATLPVVPVLRVYDPVRDTLREDLKAGRAVCSGGYYARQAVDGSTVRIETRDGPVTCP
ncbi:MAG TPA: hypothetical protein VKV22_08130 [Rhodanobacteraceae bacterium]|nr:hypothetical protein [Rhodanobacteraceae bacterium]